MSEMRVSSPPLRFGKPPRIRQRLFRLPVRLEGFEPPTFCFEDKCSVH